MVVVDIVKVSPINFAAVWPKIGESRAVSSARWYSAGMGPLVEAFAEDFVEIALREGGRSYL